MSGMVRYGEVRVRYGYRAALRFRERILKEIKQPNNFIWTTRKVETKLYLLPIGPNKIV